MYLRPDPSRDDFWANKRKVRLARVAGKNDFPTTPNKISLDLTDGHELLNQIGLKRGCLRKGGLLDTDKALKLILTDFRAGKLGKVMLDEI